MSLVFLVFIIIILLYSMLKNPGVFLAYILLFQSLNLNIFQEAGFTSIRYSTTLILLPFFLLLHHKKLFNKYNIINFTKHKITKGYLLLSLYIIVYSLYLGTTYEFDYLSSFLFPSFGLVIIAGLSFYDDRYIKNMYWGVIVFSLLSFIYLLLFKNFSNIDQINRSEWMEHEIGFGGPIGQARIAGILLLNSFLFIMNKQKTLVFYLILLVFIISTLWISRTGTRSPLIGIIIAVFCYFFFGGKKVRKQLFNSKFALMIIVGIIGIVILEINQSLLFERTSLLFERGAIENMPRYERYILFIDNVTDNIIFGLGPGGWGKKFHPIVGVIDVPHNMFIEYVIEYGIIGLISFFLIVVTGIINSIQVLKSNSDIYKKSIVIGWLFYLINLMFSSSLVYGSLQFYIYSAILTSISLPSNKKSNNLRKSKAPTVNY